MDKIVITENTLKNAKMALLAHYHGEGTIEELLRKTLFVNLDAVSVAAVVADLLREVDGVHSDDLCYYLYD